MNNQLMDAFDVCTTALSEGTSLDDCLARYPEMAEELRPLLLTAAGVQDYMRSVKAPQPAQAASRAKFLAAASQARKAELPERKHFPNPLSFFTRRAVFTSAFILLGIMLVTFGVIHASNKSLPGDLLYGVKRTSEKTDLLFSTSPEKRALLEAQISQRRAQEAQEITKQARTTSIEFGGQLESLNGDLGMVAGVPVTILPETQIVGAPEIGLYVWVIGKSQSDQTVKAATIRVEGRLFRGEVTSIRKQDWHIDHSNIIVSKSTLVHGSPGIGDQVDVNVRILSDGQMLAEEITLVSRGLKPTDTPPQLPIATATPTPRLPRPSPTTPTPQTTPEPGPGDQDKTGTPPYHPTPEGTHSIPTGSPPGDGDRDRDRDRDRTPHPPTQQPWETHESGSRMRDHDNRR